MKIGDKVSIGNGKKVSIETMTQTGNTLNINNGEMFVITPVITEGVDYTPSIPERLSTLEVDTNLSGKELEKVLKKLDKLINR